MDSIHPQLSDRVRSVLPLVSLFRSIKIYVIWIFDMETAGYDAHSSHPNVRARLPARARIARDATVLRLQHPPRPYLSSIASQRSAVVVPEHSTQRVFRAPVFRVRAPCKGAILL